MNANLLGSYSNGNYSVKIFTDGTKIRETDADEFIPAFPESMDLKITDYCDMGCPYCHEGSSMDGKHGAILDMAFIDTLKPYTEIAIGGGNPLAHPDLLPFLYKLKSRSLIPNMTVNLNHVSQHKDLIRDLVGMKLIYGLGVSITKVDDEVLQLVEQYPNLVLHVINGIIGVDELKKLYGTKAKVLILGYKQFRKGADYYTYVVERNQFALMTALPKLMQSIQVVSFDNLAIKQLRVQDLLPPDVWQRFYMGDDGQYTLYIDAVKQEYAKSSTSVARYKLEDDISTMFSKVRSEA